MATGKIRVVSGEDARQARVFLNDIDISPYVKNLAFWASVEDGKTVIALGLVADVEIEGGMIVKVQDNSLKVQDNGDG